jgi:ABC-type nitrate/sulfonate/bicarbonate transport system substrate-binding protein
VARQGGPADEAREDSVSEFGDLEKKAQDYVEEHPDQADKGISEAAGFAERETDHQHDQQIDSAVNAAEQHLGQNQDQNQQGNQDDQNQQGGQN